MPIPKRLLSQLLEQIYFGLFYFFIIAIPAALINFFLLGSLESDTQPSVLAIILATTNSLLSIILSPLFYALFIKKIKNFISYKQLNYKLIYSKTKEEVKPRHFILRSYVRILIYPIMTMTILPFALPPIISKGKKSMVDYLMGTEVEDVSKKD